MHRRKEIRRMAKIEMMQDDGEKRHNSPEHTWNVDQNGGFYEKKEKKEFSAEEFSLFMKMTAVV